MKRKSRKQKEKLSKFLFIANKLEKPVQKESEEEEEEPPKPIEPSRKFHGSMNNNFVF